MYMGGGRVDIFTVTEISITEAENLSPGVRAKPYSYGPN